MRGTRKGIPCFTGPLATVPTASRYTPANIMSLRGFHFVFIWLAMQALAAAADPFASLHFTDGRPRTLADFKGHAVVIVSFCAPCGRGRIFMREECVVLLDQIERERLAATIVVATPDHFGAELEDHLAAKVPGLAGRALMAGDFDNPHAISKQNSLQVRVYTDGVEREVPHAIFIEAMLAHLRVAPGRYPAPGLVEPFRGLWWAVDQQRPGAIRRAAAAIEDEPRLGPIVTAASAEVSQRLERLLARPADLATYEQLEQVIQVGDGIDLTRAQTSLEALSADPAISEELRARALWREGRALVISSKVQDQDRGRLVLEEVVSRWPKTSYGRAASLRLASR